MKFLFSSDLRRNTYLRVLLLTYFVMLLAFLGLNLGYESFRFGLTPAAIQNVINGNPDLFIEPMDLPALLTELHVHLFLYSLALLTSFSVFMHLRFSERFKVLTAAAAGAFAVLDSAALLGLRFVSPLFAWLKVLAFWSLHALFTFVVCSLLIWLFRVPRATIT